uniref:Methyltransferase type 11 domain-containing protein n=1 Tax=Schizophyllum commune (strain H4-8 / FGSC 9210) TaxID=578458 RepID=D8PL46_SCHCM
MNFLTQCEGLISQHLTAYAKSITGLDISSGMTNRYNERVENQGLEPENMRAICIDPDDDLREFEATFDVAVCAASYHHFPSIEETTLKLARTMRPGGVLMVADLVKVDGTEDLYPEHGDASLVCHQGGIAEADIRRVFGEAGLSNLRYSRLAQVD